MEERNKIKDRSIISNITFFISLLSMIGGFVSYFFIKGDIPIRWDVNWEVAATAPKEWIFVISALPLVLFVLMQKGIIGTKASLNEKGRKVSYIMISYIFIIVEWATIATAIHIDINVRFLIPMILGIAFLVIGNFMPTIKRNRNVGFRTPWTIRSEISWRKTNRYGGYLMSIVGFMLILGAILDSTVLEITAFVIMIIGFMIGTYMSYALYKKEKSQ